MNNTTAKTGKPDSDAVEAAFGKTCRDFSSLSVLGRGLVFSFFSGFHGRTGAKRIAKMRRSRPAKALCNDLAALDDRQVSHFLGLAIANKDQAEAAFRYTVIVNFTVPITLVVLINQISPGGLIELLEVYLGFDALRLSIVAIIFFTAVVYPILHAYFGVSAARDIYHLVFIDNARRGRSDTPQSIDEGGDLTADFEG